jgi:hypothetical protein
MRRDFDVGVRIGADDPTIASEVRLLFVFEQYPMMTAMYDVIRRAVGKPADWVTATYNAINCNSKDEFADLMEADPDFLPKYVFMFSMAITYNRSIPKDLRQKLLAIFYPEE